MTNKFSTSDTGLATFLITCGFYLDSIDYSNPRYEFHFPDSAEIKAKANAYTAGLALSNPAAFLKVNKKLLRIIHNQKQWEED